MEKLRSPQWIFIIYVLAASLFIIIFRFIFPGVEAPLLIYSRNWRFLQGISEVFNLFPALALSALVIPFGLASFEENYQSFSEVFFKRLVSSVITAIIAAVVYGAIFFFAFPMLKSHQENMRFSGELYQLAKNNAFERAEAGDWHEAWQFFNICNRIWYRSPELISLRDRIIINLSGQSYGESDEISLARAALARDRRSTETASQTFLPLSENQNPVDSTEAIAMSRTAFDEKRYFDAHWLANLGVRLAPNGSAQQASASRLASEAWNMITAQTPNRREQRLLEIHNLKLSGYQAMNSERWIDAYYIFQKLLTLTPDDPDAANFLAVSERGAVRTAFFIDEINYSLGEIMNGALFSLPDESGRAVLRFATLSASQDVAYGMGFEYMKFDSNNNLLASVTARYAKILPFTSAEKQQVLILTHALDRNDEEKGAKGVWLFGRETAGGLLLDISFEDFLLISHVRRGLPNLQIAELFLASTNLRTAGYISQIFHAEILNRFGTVLFFLPLSIFVIIIAWRFRAQTRPRYIFVLMLPVLPIVFHGFVFLYRAIFNTLGIWLVLTFGFVPALILFIVTLGLLLLVSLIVLAAQHS
jgi:hypothetical protein